MDEKIVEQTENEIRVRVREPGLFIEGSFKYIDISAEKGIKAVAGKLKTDGSSGPMTIQSYRFDKNKWTVAVATAWVKEHGKMTVESQVKLYEEIPLTEETHEKVTKFYRIKAGTIDEANHTAGVILSNEDKDRDEEIILLDAWKKRIKHFEEHPVMLSSHNYHSIQNQIGEFQNIKITKTGLTAMAKWYAGEGNAEADWGWNLAKKGIAMFSVGFRNFNAVSGEAIPEKYRDKEPRRVFLDVELLEASQVVVGSNRGAIQMGYESPNQMTLDYAFEVVKSFGQEIPEFDKEIKAEANTPEEPEAPGPEKKITPDSLIISPIQVKDMAELNEIMEIWKSGKVISERNKAIIVNVIKVTREALKGLEGLLKLTEKDVLGPGMNEDAYRKEVEAILERNKNLLK